MDTTIYVSCDWGGAERRGKREAYIPLYARIMHDLIELVCCDPGPDGRRCNVKDLPREATHNAHALAFAR